MAMRTVSYLLYMCFLSSHSLSEVGGEGDTGGRGYWCMAWDCTHVLYSARSCVQLPSVVLAARYRFSEAATIGKV